MVGFMKKFHRGEKGLTLIELLIVVAVLGILAAIIVPNLIGFLITGKIAAANAEAASVETAALAYYADNNGTFPSSSTELDDYLSDNTVYADYDIDDVYGKIEGVTEKAAAGDDIEWSTGDHKWIKS